MVVIEYGNSIGRRIYFGNLTAGCCNLTFENVTIRSYPSYTIPVKSLFRGNHYYSLFNENSRFVMSVYDVVNRVGTEYSLKEGSMYSDFDISIDEAILLLEEKSGIHILS
jgi:hypothetical protein